MAGNGLTLDSSTSALLVMDFQNDIVSAGGKLAPSDDEALARFAAAIDATAALLDLVRQTQLPVIHIAVGRKPDHPGLNPYAPMFQYMAKVDALVLGSDGFAFHDRLQPAAGELALVKYGISAFAGTELAQLLQARGIATLILAGTVTHWVVEGTARDAADRGYRVVAVSDCCASGSLDRHNTALENIGFIGTVVESGDLLRAVGIA
jgi:nicotinamidase-related amidase